MRHGILPKLIAGLACIAGHASVALALEGRVVDQRNGRPITNAEVSILGRPGATITDEDGRFSWKPDPVPPFEVLVVLPGGRVLKPVLVESLGQGQPLLIEVTALVEESVTVTGSAPSIEAPSASGTTLLTARDLQSRQPATLVQALETTPGVAVVSEGHAAVPALRGLARGRTLILLDGARVTSERRVGPSATFLDPFALEGVEVARGPGSVAYGSDAFGGVIYARTRRPEPGAPLRFRGLFGGGVGIPQGRVGGEVSKGFAGGGVLLLGHYRLLDDYRSPVGDVLNSGARDLGVLARAEGKVGGGSLSAGWQSDFSRDVERPRNNSNLVRFYYPEETSHRATIAYDRRSLAGFHLVSLSSFFGRHQVVTDQDRFATETRPRSIERADIVANDFHVRGIAERHMAAVKVETGAEVNGRYGLRAVDATVNFDLAGAQAGIAETLSVDGARRIASGAYITVETALRPALVVSGGARGDRVTTSNRGAYFGDRSTANAAFSGVASVTAGPHAGWSATAQIARGFRDPLLSDRYFRGPSGRGFITGFPDLRPETSLQLDLALRYTGRWFRVAGYAYQYRITDLIERYETTPDNFLFRNRGRARLRGIEAEAQVGLGAGWGLELTAQLARGLALDDGAPLDDIAPPMVSALLRREISGGGYAQLRAAAFGRDTRPGPTERDMPGYAVLDASAGIPLTSRLEVQVSARNMLDKEYLASPDPRTVPAPGASVLVSALVRWAR
ncbi:MAG TPA: TonB-dependent receptor [Vicinamibacterales bacterium]|nr:TonB-dependent receptor [Vicinamibacterales bacterium]